MVCGGRFLLRSRFHMRGPVNAGLGLDRLDDADVQAGHAVIVET